MHQRKVGVNMNDRVIDLKLVEQRRQQRDNDKAARLESSLTTSIFSLLRLYEDDPHWMGDVAVHALIDVLATCAGDEQISGLSVIKRLANHTLKLANEEEIWPADFAQWFVKDI